MKNNGENIGAALKSRTMLGGVQPSDKFSELQFRQTLTAVERMAKQSGGSLPIVDPLAFLTMGLIMDKLNDISERLTKLEARDEHPNP